MNLARQQQQLLEALALPRHADAMDFIANRTVLARAGAPNEWDRGLRAYRSQSHALAQRALAAAYPVVAQLLGEENFEPLARSLWQRHPPVRGDLAQWGGELASFLAAQPGLAEQEPYLPDVARAEWALHAIATAPDAQPDPGSWGLLATADPGALALVLSPGTVCIDSRYPVASIVAAHLEGRPSLQEAGALLRDNVAETAVVWRQGLRPRLRCAAAGEPEFLAALQEQRSLANALNGAPALDFSAWLPAAAQEGLLVAVRPL